MQSEQRGFATEAPETGGQVLVEGTTFCVSGLGGDIDGGSQGLFVQDTRVISRWRLLIDGHPVDPLGGFTVDPYAGAFFSRGRLRDGCVEPTLITERRRFVGNGMREDLVLRNFGTEPAGVSVGLEVDADFADLFDVKVGGSGDVQRVKVEAGSGAWTASARSGPSERMVLVRAPGASVTVDGLGYRAVVPEHGEWRTSIEVSVSVDGNELPGRFALESPVERSAPARRLAESRRRSPTLRSSDSFALQATVARSELDLAALRLSDPMEPDLSVIAAGAPWFMALFGRDSLITSSLMLATNPGLAVSTLRALARHQGKVVDRMSEEEPGRIVHELRWGAEPSVAPGGAERYYGTADATPLFVVLLGQLARWGADPEQVEELLPAADRALEWIRRHGDLDGDGYVEYMRHTDRGLRNQGWKDSVDGVTYADGTPPQPPIAVVEVQAYVFAAYLARSELAALLGDHEGARRWEHEARAFKERFNRDFWLDDAGYFALGLDADKRPIDAVASNAGHVLWAGAADRDHAALVAERLLSPELFSGFGIRTLSTAMGAYNPASYHNGSVWPHDTAIAVAGLMRYGFAAHAQRVAAAVVDAASYFSGRLPELFCGFAKAEAPGPVPYPASCSPQAWASAAPVGILTAMMGLDPNVPRGEIRIAPAPPREWGAVRFADVPIGRTRLTLEVDPDGTWSCEGAEGLRVIEGPVAASPVKRTGRSQ